MIPRNYRDADDKAAVTIRGDGIERKRETSRLQKVLSTNRTFCHDKNSIIRQKKKKKKKKTLAVGVFLARLFTTVPALYPANELSMVSFPCTVQVPPSCGKGARAGRTLGSRSGEHSLDEAELLWTDNRDYCRSRDHSKY